MRPNQKKGVEKETGAAFERPMIAGVFINRLKKKMRLQSDPTTIYGIYESFNGNLRKRHLLEKTPYNTYKIPALPVGPISNPGLTSINAVLNPEILEFIPGEKFYHITHLIEDLKNKGKKVGVYPIRDHYYYPLFKDSRLKKSLREPRNLPGIDFCVEKQLHLLEKFTFAKELEDMKLNEKKSEIEEFYINNGSFESGDAEFLYQLII